MLEPVRPKAVFKVTRQGVLLTDLQSLLDCQKTLSLSLSLARALSLVGLGLSPYI